MTYEERMRNELEDQLGKQEQGLHQRRRRETKYATKKVTIGESNQRSSSKTSSSIQRTLVHMDTQRGRQQGKFTRVLNNFQRVGQSRTQIRLGEKIDQLQDREMPSARFSMVSKIRSM